jgi:BirA family transcriptional regulator, biotin operon repressor / biotin---[acetyl-CoA-carboxylase] ligase
MSYIQKENVHYFPRTGSTMEVAREMAESGCSDLSVVVAGVQTKGRGRLDRSWLSDEGGLYFTMVTRPNLPPVDGFKVNFMASMALVKTLRRLCKIDVTVKWPNDILAEDKKLSGMLSEMGASEEMLNYVNVGIGVNVNNDPTDRESQATSLKILTGRTFSRKEILSAFLDAFGQDFAEQDFSGAIARWKEHAGSLNREVTVVTRQETVRGVAEDVDDDGALMVRLSDGTTRKIVYGDCFYR